MLLCILVEIILDPDTGKQILLLKKEVSKSREILNYIFRIINNYFYI
jgi:hypothetical protein